MQKLLTIMTAHSLVLLLFVFYVSTSSGFSTLDQCEWMEQCSCGKRSDTSFINCEGQTKFPDFAKKNNETVSRFYIRGTFDVVPSHSFSKVKNLATVEIAGRHNPPLTIKSFAFESNFDQIIIQSFGNVTIMENAFSKSSIANLTFANIHSINFQQRAFSKLKLQKVKFFYAFSHNLSESDFEDMEFVNGSGEIILNEIGLNSFPKFDKAGKNIVALDFAANNISEIPSLTDTGLVDLERLTLSNNPFDNKHVHNLVSYKKTLQKFVCSRCSLTSVPDELAILTELEEIDLSFNNITKIPKDVFKKMRKLKTLILSENPIGKVKNLKAAFSGLQNSPHFAEFRCDRCELTEIPRDVSNLPNLSNLYLIGNKIKKIRLGDFNSTGNKDGVTVVLNNNEIDEIEKHAMDNLQWTTLHLYNNAFVEFDLSWVPETRMSGHLLSLRNNRRLKKFYISNQSKYPTNVDIDLLGSSLEELDKKVVQLLPAHSIRISDVTTFNCSKDLRWIAECSVCVTQEARKNCNNVTIFLDDAQCVDARSVNEDIIDLYHHLKTAYMSSDKKCVF